MEKGKKNVTLLGLTSFFNDLSSEMILPILPFFLSSLGASPVLIGLVGGLRDSLERIFKIFFGYLSDKAGDRKGFVYAGYLFSSFFKILLAFSPSAIIAGSLVSLERLGKGMRDAPRDAMISRFMPQKSGAGFGLHQMLDTAGAVLGSLAVLIMVTYMAIEYGTIIFIAGLVALLSLVPLYKVKRDSAEIELKKYKFISSLSSMPRKLIIFNITASLFAIANFSYMFFILRANLGEGIATTIGLYILFNIFYAGFAYPFGKYSDRIGKRAVLVGGYLLFGLVALGFAYLSGLAMLVMLFILYGISNAAVKAVERAYVSDMAPGKLKATSLGLFQTMTGLAAIPSGLIAGFLWENVSPESAFIAGGALAFLAGGLLLIQSKD